MKENTVQRTEHRLRRLYAEYGYQPFTVRHFEPYDLYARYKNFLTCKQILTFSDRDGTLMALKPDITLSVVRSVPEDGRLRKLFYTENVYRVLEEEEGFREIRQAGVECIGPVGLYEEAEAVLLAAESLAAVQPEYILDVTDTRILHGIVSEAAGDPALRSRILDAVEYRNLPELERMAAADRNLSDTVVMLRKLLSAYGPLEQSIREAEKMELPEKSRAGLAALRALSQCLSAAGVTKVNLDFSLREDPQYYNGLALRGFLKGIPSPVLSGGRYDRLLRSLGKEGGAVGFAVYLNTLEDFGPAEQPQQPDILLEAPADAEAPQTLAEARRLVAGGKTVCVRRTTGEASSNE
jgi:ATP phosphoribosyltransferase regulatory subunit